MTDYIPMPKTCLLYCKHCNKRRRFKQEWYLEDLYCYAVCGICKHPEFSDGIIHEVAQRNPLP